MTAAVPEIHIFSDFSDAMRGSENRALGIYEGLAQRCRVTLWTEKAADPRLAALDAAGPSGCGQSARQSRCGDQSGERAAPGDATGLAGAGGGVCGDVISRHSTYPTPNIRWRCGRSKWRG